MLIERVKEAVQPYRWLHHLLKSGKWQADEIWNGRLSFSQFGEDLMLEALLNSSGRSEGFYLDIGAYHPLHFSNTYYFYKQGWRGINIEPNPSPFAAFPKRRPRDINLNLAISHSEQHVKFACSGLTSGICDENYLFADKAQQTISVAARPLADVLDEFLPKGQSIDFATIDCEGHDLVVLQSNNWHRYKPKVLLVEEHEARADAALTTETYLTEIGYRYHCRMGYTCFYTL